MGSFAPMVLAVNNRLLHDFRPLLSYAVPIKFFGVPDRGIGHSLPQVGISDEPGERLAQLMIGICQQARDTVNNIIGLVASPRNTGQPTGRSLPKNLRMSLDFAWEEKYLRLSHFLAQLRRVQVPQKLDVLAIAVTC